MSAPTVLNYGGMQADHDHIVGPIVASIAIISAWEITRPLRWMNVLMGLWLIAAPLILTYQEATPAWNSIFVGIASFIFSMVRGKLTHSFGGGWRSLRFNR